METGEQRCIEARGNHRGCRGGIKGQDYLTDEERQEALLLRQMFVISSNDDSIHSQEKLQNLPND